MGGQDKEWSRRGLIQRCSRGDGFRFHRFCNQRVRGSARHPGTYSVVNANGRRFPFQVQPEVVRLRTTCIKRSQEKKQPTNPRARYGALSLDLVYGLDPVCLIMGEACDTLGSMIMIATRHDADAWETLISRQPVQYTKTSTRSAAINLFRRSVMRAVRRPRVIRQMCLKLKGPNQLRA